MPLIELSGNVAVDRAYLHSVMLWPRLEEDSRRRAQFQARNKCAQILTSHPTAGEIKLPRDLLQDLLEAPSRAQTRAEAGKRAKRAITAGQVFATMYLLHGLNEAPSLNRAVAAIAAWGRDGALYGDRTPQPHGDGVDESWKDYRSVAHLWAAQELCRHAYSISHPIDAQTLPFFFGIAGHLQNFGTQFVLENRSRGVERMLLDPGTVWLVDTERYEPSMPPLPDGYRIASFPFLKFIKTASRDQQAEN